MTLLSSSVSSPKQTFRRRSIDQWLAPLSIIAQDSSHLVEDQTLPFRINDAWHSLPRYLFSDPLLPPAPIRIGIFATIHGDEPAGLLAVSQFLTELHEQPELAKGYEIVAYPLCNPSGFEDQTRHSRQGLDLNREFWKNSVAPEVYYLEEALLSTPFHGIINLHADDTSPGLYGFVDGATLTESLLKPALLAASKALPLNPSQIIDGFDADQGIIRSRYPGILSAPPTLSQRPFEITFETPATSSLSSQANAMTLALHSILTEYRSFISYAQDL